MSRADLERIQRLRDRLAALRARGDLNDVEVESVKRALHAKLIDFPGHEEADAENDMTPEEAKEAGDAWEALFRQRLKEIEADKETWMQFPRY